MSFPARRNDYDRGVFPNRRATTARSGRAGRRTPDPGGAAATARASYRHDKSERYWPHEGPRAGVTANTGASPSIVMRPDAGSGTTARYYLSSGYGRGEPPGTPAVRVFVLCGASSSWPIKVRHSSPPANHGSGLPRHRPIALSVTDKEHSEPMHGHGGCNSTMYRTVYLSTRSVKHSHPAHVYASSLQSPTPTSSKTHVFHGTWHRVKCFNREGDRT